MKPIVLKQIHRLKTSNEFSGKLSKIEDVNLPDLEFEVLEESVEYLETDIEQIKKFDEQIKEKVVELPVYHLSFDFEEQQVVAKEEIIQTEFKSGKSSDEEELKTNDDVDLKDEVESTHKETSNLTKKINKEYYDSDRLEHRTCKDCNKVFSRVAVLNQHINTVHLGLRPYHCGFCEKSFGCRSNLVEHVRLHTGERPYVCKACNSDFRARGLFTKHVKIHHPARVEELI